MRRGQAGVLLRDNVYHALRGAILTCALPPGQDLRELDLAAQYSVSRSPVRDALLRLERERLVTVLPRQGYRVNPVSLQDARDIFGLRLVIEPACAAEAALAADTRGLDAFRRHSGKERDFIAYNRAFHAALADLSGNGRMAAVARDLVDQSDRLVRVSLRTLGVTERDRLVAEHVTIIDAIQAGDGAAAAVAVHQHVAEARARVLLGLENTNNRGNLP
jgi:DNA-binding GntR family transcriptional regulator